MNQDKEIVFDTEFGLNQLSGNKELLIKMLDRFAADYASVDAELQDAVAQQDMATGKAKAHTIKGVAGNLGMWKLHHCSKELEESFKSAEGDFADSLAQFKAVMAETLTALTQFKNGGDAPAAEAEAGSESPQGAKAELLALLEGFEFIDANKLQQLLNDAGVDADKHAQIQQAISDLDYPTAIELINS